MLHAGLSCAALLAKYGMNVTVCESHTIPGGAAHAWERGGYHFESGPSLYSGGCCGEGGSGSAMGAGGPHVCHFRTGPSLGLDLCGGADGGGAGEQGRELAVQLRRPGPGWVGSAQQAQALRPRPPNAPPPYVYPAFPSHPPSSRAAPAGMASRGRGANPLAHVLQAIGEELDLVEYGGWNVLLPEGQFWMEVSVQRVQYYVGARGVGESKGGNRAAAADKQLWMEISMRLSCCLRGQFWVEVRSCDCRRGTRLAVAVAVGRWPAVSDSRDSCPLQGLSSATLAALPAHNGHRRC